MAPWEPTREAVEEEVRRRYGDAARQAQGTAGGGTSPEACCGGGTGSGCCGTPAGAGFGPGGYAIEEIMDLPPGAVVASLGCGNPTAVAELRPGEVVLDLGSGGGIDVILSARRVGPRGRAYGLDMTDDMLALARENAGRAGVGNAEFLKGRIEDIPLPPDSVDVVLSNCVVNLSSDKDRVLRETWRVLRPGGRLAVSDVVVADAGPGEPEIPAAVRGSRELWSGCVAGALAEGEYRAKLAAAGFESVDVEIVRRYRAADLGEAFVAAMAGPGAAAREAADAVAGRFASAFIRARKPGAQPAPETTQP